MQYFWYATCRHCEQGRLFLMKYLVSGKLYLHCEECESGWHEPQKIDNLASRFLTVDENPGAEHATWADIEKAGWQQYANRLDS